MSIVRVTFAVFLALALPAQAEVYKCRLPDGRTEISNSPCEVGSRTVRTVAEEVVPADVREQAERDAERRRQQVERFDAERRSKEKEERETALRQPPAASNPVASSKAEECLRTLARMTLDSSRRAELEASCLATGTIPPTAGMPYYYGGGGYVRTPPPPPPHLHLHLHSKTKPLPEAAPVKPGGHRSPERLPER